MYSRKGHRNYDQYKTVTYHQHKSLPVRAYFDLYAWFWFHTEFWITNKEQRRPYTFIMRDWIYPHRNWFIVIQVAWMMLGVWLVVWILPALFPIWVGGGWLSAHLIWGSKWKPGEQEWPPVLHI